MPDWDPEAFQNALIEDMRAHGGKVTSGPLAGRPLLVMTSTGARTGQPRQSVLSFSRDGGDYVVAGTANGSPRDPRWVNNVRVQPRVSVEAENRTFEATARIAHGSERDRLWDQHVAALPHFAKYPEQTGRVIPMVRLTPVS
ncbi:MAG TPA: nitroreductase/quinone reductase family protein [Candidatus Limnocylindrales bacterium]|jgi:deazaflavin-dependent oxidoreductase (nitroreductase family)